MAVLLALSGTAFAKYDTLRVGDRSDEVAVMQLALNLVGYSIDVDGAFGRNTKAAVLAFQKDQGLKVDGLAGDQTLTRLYEAAGEGLAQWLAEQGYEIGELPQATATPVPISGGYTTLSLGSSGPAVVELQQMLITLGYSLTADGSYGTVTEAAVRLFQQEYGIQADGVAGTQTQALLNALTNNVTTTARVETTGGTLTLRKERSTNSTALTVIPFLTVVPVLQRGSTWCQVSYGGQTGYVLTRYLNFNYQGSALPTAAATATPKPTQAPKLTARVETPKGGTLTLREKRKTNSAALRLIPNWTILTVLERGSTWCTVSFNGDTGYVLTKYLNFAYTTSVNTPVPQATATPAPSEYYLATVVTDKGSLNFRTQPNTSAKVIMTIPRGTSVVVTERGSVWSAITYGGYNGYVMTAYLSFGAATAAPTATATPAPAVYTVRVKTSGSSLNIRDAATQTGSAVLTSVANGTFLTVLEKGEVWSRVSYGGYTGYAMTQYLDFSGDIWTATAVPTATPTPTPSASGYDTSIFTRTLRSGYTGADVTALQQRLQQLGYLTAVSGTYDTATVAAVRVFQTAHSLTVDGLAGKNTLTTLFSASAQAYTADLDSYTTMHIYYRDNVPSVSRVTPMQQALLNLGYVVTVNGSFDELTHNALVQFQMRNNLTPSGAADPATQRLLFSGTANGATATPAVSIGASDGLMALPATESIQLLRWYDLKDDQGNVVAKGVKTQIKTGDTLLILDPLTGISWNLRVYSRGHHADSEPQTLRDTLLMNKAFGRTSWTVHTVYVQLPDGQWTMATMHNRPHLSGSISANGFDGHLCVHFLRTYAETTSDGDTDYGMTNQRTLRQSWKNLTGEDITE